MTETKTIKSPFEPATCRQESIFATIRDMFTSHADIVALTETDSGVSITYRELGLLVERVANSLHVNYGVRPGHVIGLCSKNSVKYAVMLLACLRLDAIPCFISSGSSKDELHVYLNKCSASYLFIDISKAETALAAARDTPCQTIFTTDPHNGCISWSQIDLDIELKDDLYPLPDMDPWQHVLAYFFSSGTSGQPKVVVLRHCTMTEGFVIPVSHCHRSILNDTVIYQPLSHIYGAGVLLACLYYGYTAHLMARFNLDDYIQTIIDKKVTHLQVVPPVLIQLVQSPLVQKNNTLSHVKRITASSAVTTPELEEQVRKIINKDVEFANGYGMTETGTMCHTPSSDKNIPPPLSRGSVGVPSHMCQVKICDLNTGASLGPGERGELRTHVPYRMAGYLDNPQATADMVDDEGWVRTGDVAWYDENGHVYIVDRIKEIIRYNGLQVSPTELEGVLLSHPLISDVGVTSVSCEVAGELPRAWVVRTKHCLTEDMVKLYVEGKCARYKSLRGGVCFVDEIPRSPNGKIMRRLMKNKR